MATRIYDYLKSHKTVGYTALLCITALLAVLTMRLSYKEDISDFLPLNTKDREALNIYQDISGANRLFILFSGSSDADSITAAIDAFCESVSRRDTAHWTADMTAQVDMEKVQELQAFTYGNIPYFLTEADYARMDSLLAKPGYISSQLQSDKEMLMLPSGGLLSYNISRDPLNLFTPVVARLQQSSADIKFTTHDGYLFTPDMSRAIVMLTSPFGNAETERNSMLIDLLEQAVADMNRSYPTVEAHVAGGPQIAVGNARQIKHDSIIAIALSAILILALLLLTIRSLKSILLIAVSIAWGWLFALGGMALFHNNVSIIVIGMASIILGIAVNYPLHLVTHSRHEHDIRQCLRDIAAPLLIGNITTVGAFMALIPLQSTALRDLGIFAALLLIGTIAFVLVFLPQWVAGNHGSIIEVIRSWVVGRRAEKVKKSEKVKRSWVLGFRSEQPKAQRPTTHNHQTGRCDQQPITSNHQTKRCDQHRTDQQTITNNHQTKRNIAVAIILLTIVFSWFALQTKFNPDMASINYMTPQQKADMEYFISQLENQSVSDSVSSSVSGSVSGSEVQSFGGLEESPVDRHNKPSQTNRHKQTTVTSPNNQYTKQPNNQTTKQPNNQYTNIPNNQRPTTNDQQSERSIPLYIPTTAATIDAALDKRLALTHRQTAHPLSPLISQFLVSRNEQSRRLALWHNFLRRHSVTLSALTHEASKQGFTAESFADFHDILQADYTPQPFNHFAPLTSLVFSRNVSIDSINGRYTIVDQLQVPAKHIEQAKATYPGSFDVKGMNASMVAFLSDNFNYIGIACSTIVFLFLWFSFRRIELAIIAFTPMAIGWIWILGIMALLGVEFNIVNIILATFIFGQGDDYTIFITEGCIHEHLTGKPILASYRRSILISALIMLIGIGTLITARHPALHSLAEVTIIGMACVVLMAWTVPPMMFRLLLKYRPQALSQTIE